ncbi:hypothetical protein HYE82_31365 [Streptomyces sp. BR123]|uniref:hypothetical protein n=1 Tax=Streptomyces sp. BR123 TaxID=2749828 RepID=UPI0015C447E1|nr:hypothetical protein [Streptomyces sp. BR123]NXY98801.1 hypothetical protein [Streptomyces sp. BR123]
MRRGEPAPPRARDSERTRPFNRADRQVAPEDHLYEPGRPAGQNARHGEDTRLYRKRDVKAS